MTEEQTKLVEDNIGLVRFAMNKYYPTLIMDEDAYQVACMGLIKASKTYDPAIYRFSTYAVTGVRYALSNYIQSRYTKNNKGNRLTESLDEEIYRTDNLTYGDSIGVADFTADTDFEIVLEEIMAKLDEIDKKILELRIEGHSFEEIGSLLYLTKQAVYWRTRSRIMPVAKKMLEVAS